MSFEDPTRSGVYQTGRQHVWEKNRPGKKTNGHSGAVNKEENCSMSQHRTGGS